jgi:hypothetical protein
MAAIAHARTVALQATSPRIVAVALPTNMTVDLSNTSQALNNLPSYTRVSGVTALATQSTLANGGGYLTGFGAVSSQASLALGGGYLTGFGSVAGQNSLAYGGGYLTGFGAVATQASLAYGGSYLTGFGVLASQATVNLASQITGALANSNVSGLGALALLGSVALDGVYVVNNLAATRIGAGTIAAGVIYAGNIAASQITSGYIAAARINAGSLTVDKLGNSYVPGTSNHVSFSMGAAWSTGSNYAGGIYLADSTAYFPLLAYNNGNGYAFAAATTDTAGTYSAVVTWGGWNGNTTAPTYATSAYLTSGIFGGKFVYGSNAQVATLGTASYAGKFAYGTTYDAVLGDSANGIAGRFRAGASGAYTRSVSLCDGNYAVNIDNGLLRYAGVTVSVPPDDTKSYLRGDGTWKRLEKVSDGAATATYIGTTKPGGASNNGWAVMNISGTDYYIPVWT